jgi:uncharacterized membrane protein YfcA
MRRARVSTCSIGSLRGALIAPAARGVHSARQSFTRSRALLASGVRSGAGAARCAAGTENAGMDPSHVAAMGVVFVLAGAVKGITGMGLPTVAVSLLGLWMTPLQAAALLVTPSLLTNIAQCLGPALRPLAWRLWPAWLALAAAIVWMPEPRALRIDARALLGAVLVLYGAWGLWRPSLPDLSRRTRWVGVLVGLATGAVTTVTAVFAIPLVPYLQTLRLDKDAMVQALGLSFTVATLALAVRLGQSGTLVLLSWESLVALGAAMVGMALGAAVRSRISATLFQRALMVVFIGLGAANLLRA